MADSSLYFWFMFLMLTIVTPTVHYYFLRDISRRDRGIAAIIQSAFMLVVLPLSPLSAWLHIVLHVV